MSRTTAIVVAALAAAVLGAFVWLWLNNDSPSEADLDGAGASDSAGETMLTDEDQTPVQAPQETQQPSETTVVERTAEADAGPYKFERWEDAADYLAELVGLEYDARLAAGLDQNQASSQAYHAVDKRIFEDKEDPALLEALRPYMPYADSVPMEKRTQRAMPIEEYGSTPFLVRAGRLPPSALKLGYLSLPNGNRHYYDADEEVIVKYQKRFIPAETEAGKAQLAMWEGILAKANTELVQNPDDQETQEAIR